MRSVGWFPGTPRHQALISLDLQPVAMGIRTTTAMARAQLSGHRLGRPGISSASSTIRNASTTRTWTAQAPSLSLSPLTRIGSVAIAVRRPVILLSRLVFTIDASVIHALRAASGAAGLAAFLPEHGRKYTGGRRDNRHHSQSDRHADEPPHLPLVSDWTAGDFALRDVIISDAEVDIREWTLRMLERYRFVIGLLRCLFSRSIDC